MNLFDNIYKMSYLERIWWKWHQNWCSNTEMEVRQIVKNHFTHKKSRVLLGVLHCTVGCEPRSRDIAVLLSFGDTAIMGWLNRCNLWHSNLRIDVMSETVLTLTCVSRWFYTTCEFYGYSPIAWSTLSTGNDITSILMVLRNDGGPQKSTNTLKMSYTVWISILCLCITHCKSLLFFSYKWKFNKCSLTSLYKPKLADRYIFLNLLSYSTIKGHEFD